jgi:deoxyadenosine/deoxycytidine kinase
MGKIIAIAGNLGAGKTTLTRLLCAQGGFNPCWESPQAHPFQRAFTADPPRWALANQLDFYLFRCQQERIARQGDEIAVFDAGFDQDFYVFTRHIHHKGYLSADEFDLCRRFYAFARAILPPPDLIIRLQVLLPTLLARRATRRRETVDQSFDPQQFSEIEARLDEWLNGYPSSAILLFPLEKDIHACEQEVAALIGQIHELFANR